MSRNEPSVREVGDTIKALIGPKRYRQAVLELASIEANEMLNKARKKFGDEDLAPFRDEWELARRLESKALSLRK